MSSLNLIQTRIDSCKTRITIRQSFESLGYQKNMFPKVSSNSLGAYQQLEAMRPHGPQDFEKLVLPALHSNILKKPQL